jgi:hypothetical protein
LQYEARLIEACWQWNNGSGFIFSFSLQRPGSECLDKHRDMATLE